MSEPPALEPAEFIEAELIEEDGEATLRHAGGTDAATLKRPGYSAPRAATTELAPRATPARRVPVSRGQASKPLPPAHPLADGEGLVSEARRRAEAAAKNSDRLVLARARLEHAVLLEVLVRDLPAAETAYRAAHAIAPSLRAPIAAVRRLASDGKVSLALTLVEAELRATGDDGNRAPRLLEMARLLLVGGAAPDKAVQAFRDVLALVPDHPGALRGLEKALRARPRALEHPSLVDALAAHLATMASAFRDDRRLSAWLEVERAVLLERLQRPDAARVSLRSALELDPGLGPVREAYVRHLIAHQHVDLLVDAWSEEATLEGDTARAGRLLYAAGRLASERLEQSARAIELHRRAAALSATALFTRRRALDELARLYAMRGDDARATEALVQVLAWAAPDDRPYWHTRLAIAFDASKQWEEAADHAGHALVAWPDDDELRERRDRLLATCKRHEERLTLWMREASRAGSVRARTDALLCAARVAERDLGRPAAALTALRAAWALEPDHLVISDELDRLLTSSAADRKATAEALQPRVDLLIEMAATSSDPERKALHLERLAALFEDQLGAPERARDVYRDILAIDGQRRSAIIGLARTAARAGDARELFRALVLEADQVGSAALSRSLLLRAAELASRELGDADTALDLVSRVRSRNAGDPQALRAAADIHLRTGRHEDAVAHLRTLSQHVRKGPASLAILIEMARLLDGKLRRPADAIAAYREASRLDPFHPLPMAELRALYLANEDYPALARELAACANALASDTAEAAQRTRGRLLFEAAEIYGDRLDEPDAQLELLLQARACCPDEPELVDALERVYVRQGKLGELALLLEQKGAGNLRDELALASLLADGRDLPRATALLRSLSSRAASDVATLRTLEHACARGEQWGALAEVLRSQTALFASKEARIGALAELFVAEELRGVAPAADGASAVELLIQITPNDVLVHEAVLRAGVHADDLAHANRLANSLGVLAAAANDALHAGVLQLSAALLLERLDGDDPHVRREAARRFRSALSAWPDCLTAARGVYRLGLGLADSSAVIVGAIALGALETDAVTRAERLAEAADGLRGSGERARAEELYARALGEHADSVRAADGLIALAASSSGPAAIAAALRAASERTRLPEQAVRLGAALAALARSRLADPTVALEALRRARKKAPGNVPNLLALADACAAVELWPEAAEIAEGALGITRDASERLAAAVVVAGAHAHLPNARGEAAHRARQAEELAAAASPQAQTAWLGRLADVYRLLGDGDGALRVLARALACSGAAASTLELLAQHAPPTTPEGARTFAAVVERAIAIAEQMTTPVEASWLTALGVVEAQHLGLVEQGLRRVGHALARDQANVASYEALSELWTSTATPERAARELLARVPNLLSAGLPADKVTPVLLVVSRACAAAALTAEAQHLEQIAAYLHGDMKSRAPAWSDPAPRAGALSPSVLGALLSRASVEPWLELTSLLSDVLPKVLRGDPAALGVLPRDRIAKGEPHPLRVLADRVARAFGDLDFDLYVDAGTVAAPRLVPSDPPSLVLPRGYADLSISEQGAGMGRLLVYVALGVPWADELGREDFAGVLYGALRVAREGWSLPGWNGQREASVESWRARLARVLSRKHKRALDELAARAAVPADPDTFRTALRTVAVLGAYLVTGDLVSTLNHLRRVERDLGAPASPAAAHPLLQNATSRRLVAYALEPDAMALARSVLR